MKVIQMLFKKVSLIFASLFAVGGLQAAPPLVTTTLPISIQVTAANPATTCALVLEAPYSSLTYVGGAAAAETQYRGGKINCNGTNAVPYTISAGAGNHATTTRRAASGTNYVNYRLVTSNGLSRDFDDATVPLFGGVPITGTTMPSGTTSIGFVNFNVEVPAGQTPAGGTYTDTVTLTTTF